MHHVIKLEFMEGSGIERVSWRFKGFDLFFGSLLKLPGGLGLGADGVGQLDHPEKAGFREVEVVQFATEVSQRIQHIINYDLI
jgi:hypothetical protein